MMPNACSLAVLPVARSGWVRHRSVGAARDCARLYPARAAAGRCRFCACTHGFWIALACDRACTPGGDDLLRWWNRCNNPTQEAKTRHQYSMQRADPPCIWRKSTCSDRLRSGSKRSWQKQDARGAVQSSRCPLASSAANQNVLVTERGRRRYGGAGGRGRPTTAGRQAQRTRNEPESRSDSFNQKKERKKTNKKDTIQTMHYRWFIV